MPCRAFEQLFEGRSHSLALLSLMESRQLCVPWSVFFSLLLQRRYCPTFWDLACLCYCKAFKLQFTQPTCLWHMICSPFKFAVHSSKVSLKGTLTQSVFSEEWFLIHSAKIYDLFLHLNLVKKLVWPYQDQREGMYEFLYPLNSQELLERYLRHKIRS